MKAKRKQRQGKPHNGAHAAKLLKQARRIAAAAQAGPISTARPRRVKSLQKFLKAYGTGADARVAREGFASRLGTTLPYLVHLGYGFRTASAELAVEIEKRTHGLVKVEELRPDVDWAYLVKRKGNVVIAAAA